MQNFLQPHLASWLLWRRGRAARGTSKPSVVETNVSQSAGSKASLAEVGLMAQSPERGFQKSSRSATNLSTKWQVGMSVVSVLMALQPLGGGMATSCAWCHYSGQGLRINRASRMCAGEPAREVMKGASKTPSARKTIGKSKAAQSARRAWDASVSLESLRERQAAFAKERAWDQHHTPRNLALAMVGEVKRFPPRCLPRVDACHLRHRRWLRKWAGGRAV